MHKVSPASPARTPDDLRTLLGPLVGVLAQLVAEELGARHGEDDLVDLSTSPAGQDRAYRSARRGEIAGAQKIRRRWWASRAAHDQWLASISVRPSVPSGENEKQEAPASGVDALASRLGLRKVARDDQA